MKIAVTGATGFVGKHLIQWLLENTEHEVVGLSRSPRISSHERLQYVRCDLYSLYDAEEALAGCDAAVYLVHSMLPSSRLSQGNFEDFDYILADNFAKAAKKNELKHIIYVGGIIPENEKLSKHLESRLEVEACLKASGINFTALRCALVLGSEGSSFTILEKLVERLPCMILPSWTQTESQVVFLDDLLQLIQNCLERPQSATGVFDVGAPDIVSYRKLIMKMAEIKNKSGANIPLPFVPLFLSKLWVRLITGSSKALVYPLIDSLVHKMTAREDHLPPKDIAVEYVDVETALKLSVAPKRELKSFGKSVAKPDYKSISFVQSVQRLPVPRTWDMTHVASHYLNWLLKVLGVFFKLKKNGDELAICFFLIKEPLLVLNFSRERTFPGRELFYITGGVLVKEYPRSRLEFRKLADEKCFIAAIHAFRPALPWYIYRFTQAPIHKFVMTLFGKHLEDIDKAIAKKQNQTKDT